MQNRDIFTCRDCHEQFPVSESVKDASRKRGIMERCKSCDRKRKKDHRQEAGDQQRVKVRDAMRALKRERRAAGMGWADSLTDEQLEIKRAASRKYNREKRWKAIGASPEYYAEQFGKQDGRCAICGADVSWRGFEGKQDEFFCIDHDHITDQLRGLLCANCNSMIGSAADDPERLAKAIAYLAAWGITGSRAIE